MEGPKIPEIPTNITGSLKLDLQSEPSSAPRSSLSPNLSQAGESVRPPIPNEISSKLVMDNRPLLNATDEAVKLDMAAGKVRGALGRELTLEERARIPAGASPEDIAVTAIMREPTREVSTLAAKLPEEPGSSVVEVIPPVRVSRGGLWKRKLLAAAAAVTMIPGALLTGHFAGKVVSPSQVKDKGASVYAQAKEGVGKAVQNIEEGFGNDSPEEPEQPIPKNNASGGNNKETPELTISQSTSSPSQEPSTPQEQPPLVTPSPDLSEPEPTPTVPPEEPNPTPTTPAPKPTEPPVEEEPAPVDEIPPDTGENQNPEPTPQPTSSVSSVTSTAVADIKSGIKLQ